MSLKISWKSTDAKKGASGGAPDGGGRLWGGVWRRLGAGDGFRVRAEERLFFNLLIKKKV